MKKAILMLLSLLVFVGSMPTAYSTENKKEGVTREVIRNEENARPYTRKPRKVTRKTTKRHNASRNDSIDRADNTTQYELLYQNEYGVEVLALIFYTDNEYCIAIHKDADTLECVISGGVVEEKTTQWTYLLDEAQYDELLKLLRNSNKKTDFDRLYMELKK